jgi:hypothetical protein
MAARLRKLATNHGVSAFASKIAMKQWVLKCIKSQIANPKSQINTNDSNSKNKTVINELLI